MNKTIKKGMNPCIFSSQGQHPFRYDICRACLGYTEGCPNYLGEYIYSKPITARKSPSASLQTLLEGKALNEPIGVVSVEGRTSTTVSRTHSESYSQREKPFSWYHSRDRILEPLLPRPDFLKRFRRSQE